MRQSLSLWREVAHEMFKLWILAEQDLLENLNTYRLKYVGVVVVFGNSPLCRDTGQGLNRVQAAPRISKAMQNLVHKVQLRVGPDNWVGSSVVHLGDHSMISFICDELFTSNYRCTKRINVY